MSAPRLTSPILLSLDDLTSNIELTSHIAALVNAAFVRAHSRNPEKWDVLVQRFPTTQHLLDTVGTSGVVAVILDESRTEDTSIKAQDETGVTRKGEIIACAIALPWSGGWENEGAATETGWEYKAVCVDGDARYLKKGVAARILQALDDCLVLKEKERLRKCTADARGQESESDTSKKALLNLWVLTADCLNGDYWRKKGYTEVRRKTWSGLWHCKTSFDLLVLRRDVEFEI